MRIDLELEELRPLFLRTVRQAQRPVGQQDRRAVREDLGQGGVQVGVLGVGGDLGAQAHRPEHRDRLGQHRGGEYDDVVARLDAALVVRARVLGREDRSYIAKTFVEKLLKDNHTKRIVVVGNPTVDIPTLLKQKTLFWSYLNQEDIVGEYRDGEIKINGLDINKGLEKAEGVEALKINASLDAIIIHHRDWDEVEEVGFGFNEIDLLVVTKDTKKDDRFKNTLKYWLQKKIKRIRTVRG